MDNGQISKEIPIMFQKLIFILNKSFDRITVNNENNIEKIKLEKDDESIAIEKQNILVSDEKSNLLMERSSSSKNLLLDDSENTIEIVTTEANTAEDSVEGSSTGTSVKELPVVPSVLLSPPRSAPLSTASPSSSSSSASSSSSSSTVVTPNAFCAMRAGLETVSPVLLFWETI